MPKTRENSIGVRAQETVPKPNMKWENGTYSMNNVLRKFKLPRVVQCTSVQANDVTREKSNFDFLQPMLLYGRHECKKVTANSLNIDQQTGQTTEIGDPLLVPEDYKGWFAVLNTRTKNKAVPHYRKVGQLAQSDCDTFLIGGTECVQAVQRLKKDCPPETRILYPGDVLKMGNIYIASTKVRTGRFSKPQKKEEKFLLCTDQNDREVLMPIDSTGMFYIVRNKTKQTPVPVMQMRDIISNTPFPCEVKLIFGRLPTTPCFFTGMLVLKNVFPETSAVASSIVNLRNIMLEIPIDIPMMFRVAVSDKALLENRGYKDAVRLCQEKADTYMRNIKVSQGQVGDDEDVQHQNEEVSVPSYSPSHQQHQNPSVPSIPEKHIPRKTANNDSRSSEPTGPAGFGHSVLPIPPKSNTPNRYPVPTVETPPLPPRKRVQSRSESAESNSPPRPPPQDAKPSRLERVVTQRAPPPMVRLDQHQSGYRDSQAPGRVSQYEEVWLETKPEQKAPPKPPPKCFPSSLKPMANLQLLRQRSVTISVNDGYLTVPVFSSQSREDSSSNPDEDMSLAEKLNFWKRLDETSQAASCEVSGGTGNCIARTGSVVYSECGISKDKSKTDKQRETREQGAPAPEVVDGKIYENIEDLRQVRIAKNSQIVFDNPDAMYESVDDVVYEVMDALPVGASANRASYADSGIMDDGAEDQAVETSSAVAEMSVTQIFESLKEVGVSHKTREYLRKERVDGRLLTTFSEDSLKSNFPSISNIEIKKIGLFIRGLN